MVWQPLGRSRATLLEISTAASADSGRSAVKRARAAAVVRICAAMYAAVSDPMSYWLPVSWRAPGDRIQLIECRAGTCHLRLPQGPSNTRRVRKVRSATDSRDRNRERLHRSSGVHNSRGVTAKKTDPDITYCVRKIRVRRIRPRELGTELGIFPMREESEEIRAVLMGTQVPGCLLVVAAVVIWLTNGGILAGLICLLIGLAAVITPMLLRVEGPRSGSLTDATSARGATPAPTDRLLLWVLVGAIAVVVLGQFLR